MLIRVSLVVSALTALFLILFSFELPLLRVPFHCSPRVSYEEEEVCICVES